MENKQRLTGLTAAEVIERRENGLSNVSSQKAGKSVKEIVISNTFTYFNFIFLIITVLLCIVGSFRNLTFLPIVIGNTLVGIVQEIRAKKTIDKMNLLNAPHAVAVRDGQRIKLRSEELVKDDIVIFYSGNQICADAKVLKGSVTVIEALLTGEEDEITKNAGDRLLSGSFIVSGECLAVLENVGDSSYISKLTAEAKSQQDGEQSEMIKAINKIVKWMGIILIPIGGVLFYQSFFVKHLAFKSSVVSTVAAVIGMIPEGLYLLTTAALALGTIRLAKRKVLLNDMKSIEALARVDVLCVDKTGTITEPEMQVNKLIELADTRDLPDTGFKEMLFNYVSAAKDNNSTMEALRGYFEGFNAEKMPPLTVLPFTSAVKYGAVTFKTGTWLLGAPEFVLKSIAAPLKKQVEEYTLKGYRVLVFAYQYDPLTESGPQADILPVGLIVMANAIRKNAPATFRYFKAQGVKIKVISGDNPATVAEIARLAGIDNAENYIDAALLDTDEKLYNAAREYTVFGRVTPRQKQKLVSAMQEMGHTVAMTGDGVNDILAMKRADCGIAMASGSEAVSQAARVVLMDSDFAHMPSVVAEGRRVVNNIQRSASLFLVKNIFSLLLSVTASVLMISYPLEPAHISLISMFTIGLPGFLLALESNKSKINGHFLKNVLKMALPAALTDTVTVGSLALFGEVFGLNKSDVATAATLVLAAVGFMILRHISTPLNKYRLFVFVINIIGMILCFLFVPQLFSIVRIPATIMQLVIIFSFAAESLFRIFTWAVEHSGDSIKRRLAKRPKRRKASHSR